MRYRLHDTNSYGIYNGICKYDVSDYIYQTAKTLGLDFFDYDTDSIVRTLNKDEELKSIAQESYIPYPIKDEWLDEYKEYYLKAMAERTAPGTAEIQENIVQTKIEAILTVLADKILPKRRAEEAAAVQERESIMSSIADVSTIEKIIYDEGGKTKQYTHTVTMKSGTILKFTDMNVFDFGRIINPLYSIVDGAEPGGVYSNHDGRLVWIDFINGKGWEPVRPLTNDEVMAVKALSKYYGYCNAAIRM